MVLAPPAGHCFVVGAVKNCSSRLRFDKIDCRVYLWTYRHADRQTDRQTKSGNETDDWRLTLAPYCSRISTTLVWPASDAMWRLVLPFYTQTHIETLLKTVRMATRTSESLNHHPRPQCIGMQLFSNSSEFLTLSCSHKNLTMISQTVQELSRWQTDKHTRVDRHTIRDRRQVRQSLHFNVKLICALRQILNSLCHVLVSELANELSVQQLLAYVMLYLQTSSELPLYLHLKRNSRPFFSQNIYADFTVFYHPLANS